MMLATQYYIQTILKVDVNNIFTGVENGDIGAVA